MNHFTIYHNPKCSKSREALNMLQQHHIQPTIIEYLKCPLSLEQITHLKAHFELKEFVRQHEPIFKTLNLSLNNEVAVLTAMSHEPILMQRPIITCGERAIIGRSVETITNLINDIEKENKK